VRKTLRAENRIGLGHDTHRLGPGGPLRLGGVEVPHDAHLIGHSDADVLLHAVTDALLGAIAAGDIGDLFPDTDPANRNRDSADMLHESHQRVQRAGYRVQNLDCVVFAQRPKLGASKRIMGQRIAEILGIPCELVSVKAKTGEGVGPVGQELAISAQCVALLGPGQQTSGRGEPTPAARSIQR